MSKQVIRSGTAIGALVREAEFAQSKTDFAHKMNIALKEANETDYWLKLLNDAGFTDGMESFSFLRDSCNELIAMLVATVKTSRLNISKNRS